MGKHLQKRLDEFMSLAQGTPSFTDINAGNNIDRHIEKFPQRQGVEFGGDQFSQRDNVASHTLPNPLENSIEDLVEIYTKLLDYRKKVKRAADNPQVKESPRKTKVIRTMRRRLVKMMKVIRAMADSLDSLQMEVKEIKQIGLDDKQFVNLEKDEKVISKEESKQEKEKKNQKKS